MHFFQVPFAVYTMNCTYSTPVTYPPTVTAVLRGCVKYCNIGQTLRKEKKLREHLVIYTMNYLSLTLIVILQV